MTLEQLARTQRKYVVVTRTIGENGKPEADPEFQTILGMVGLTGQELIGYFKGRHSCTFTNNCALDAIFGRAPGERRYVKGELVPIVVYNHNGWIPDLGYGTLTYENKFLITPVRPDEIELVGAAPTLEKAVLAKLRERKLLRRLGSAEFQVDKSGTDMTRMLDSLGKKLDIPRSVRLQLANLQAYQMEPREFAETEVYVRPDTQTKLFADQMREIDQHARERRQRRFAPLRRP